jgi:hypothetical protein
MKRPTINSNAIPDAVIPPAVIPANAGIQPNQASGFRVKPGMTFEGFILNTQAMKPGMDKKVEYA